MDNSNIDQTGEPVQPERIDCRDAGSRAPAPRNPFRRLWELGYRRLVPIVPPAAELSPHSSLAKRPACRGKAVGELGPHGWRGFNWHQHETTEADLDRWFAMGAGVGTRTGAGLMAIDVDTLDADLASQAMAIALEILGPAPRRIGRAPKVLLPYRTPLDQATGYQRVEFAGAGGKTERVEILGEGRQYVTGGIHPGTLRPYSWPDGVPAFAALTLVTPEQIQAYFDRLLEIMPAAARPRSSISNVDRSLIDQTTLHGDVAYVRTALAAIANDRPDRERFIRVCAAVKAALPDDPEEASDIAWEWASQHTSKDGSAKTYDSFLGDWNGLHGPFEIGASYLYGEAARHTGECMAPAMAFFDVVEAESVDTSAFAERSSAGANPKPPATDTFRLLSLGELMNMPTPKFLIDRHLPEAALGFLYGDPGTGKSFIALDWSLHIAFGLPAWHGDAINAPKDAHVVYIAGEGVAGLNPRVRAWMHSHGFENTNGRFSLLQHSVNFMDRDQVHKLARTIRQDAPRTVLVVVDTVSRALPGADENHQKEMTRFVDACDAFCIEFGCVVLGVHHAARQAGNMRGSTVLTGAGGFVFKLERKPAKPVGQLLCEKQKDAPDGWHEAYRFDPIAFPGGESLVPTRCLTTSGDGAPMLQTQEDQILDAIDTAWRRKEPWGQFGQSGSQFAVTRLVQDFGIEADRAREVLRTMVDVGSLTVDVVNKKSKKRGYRRLIGETAAPLPGGVFD